MKVKERTVEEDNLYMFKRFARYNPPVHNGTPDPKAFKDWIGGMEKLFDALQWLEEWKVGFAMFYLKDKVNLWWATVRERQHEPGCDWKGFKGLIKDYSISYHSRRQSTTNLCSCNKGNECARICL